MEGSSLSAHAGLPVEGTSEATTAPLNMAAQGLSRAEAKAAKLAAKAAKREARRRAKHGDKYADKKALREARTGRRKKGTRAATGAEGEGEGEACAGAGGGVGAGSTGAGAAVAAPAPVTGRHVIGFWQTGKPYGFMSQWKHSPFHDPETGQDFQTAENYMMYSKALLFGDLPTAKRILDAHPAKAKSLGRKVAKFHDGTWRKARFKIVARGTLLKFQQNPDLAAKLLATGDLTLAEASPRDRIWGIGLAPDDPRTQDPSKWQGSNLLGEALMAARHTLREELEAGHATLTPSPSPTHVTAPVVEVATAVSAPAVLPAAAL